MTPNNAQLSSLRSLDIQKLRFWQPVSLIVMFPWIKHMGMPKEVEMWERVTPTEENGFCIFPQSLEDNPLIFFHATLKQNLEAIIISGFRSAAELGLGGLTSVSYAKRSSSCLAYIGKEAREDYVVFAVEFDALQQQGVKENISDIHVYKSEIQPGILGYCKVPKGFRVS